MGGESSGAGASRGCCGLRAALRGFGETMAVMVVVVDEELRGCGVEWGIDLNKQRAVCESCVVDK